MNLKGLQALQAFMETGSMAGAVERLHRTQPQISRLLSALEEEVGFPLFTRRNRRLIPTDRARVFYAQVEHVLAGFNELDDMAKRVRDNQTDHVRVLTAPYAANGLMTPALRQLIQEMPDLTMSLDSRTRANLQLWLGREQFDLAVAVLPMESEWVDVEPLVTIRAVAVMDEAHPLASRDRIVAEDLATTPSIVTTGHSVLRDRLDLTLEERGIRPNIRFETPVGFIGCQLAGQGLGLCIADYFVARAADGPGVVIRPFDPEIPLEYVLLFPKWQPRSPTTQRLAELIRHHAKVAVREAGELCGKELVPAGVPA